MTVERIFTGAEWESKVAYCRAVRQGSLIFVSGSAPIRDGQVVGPGDGRTQANCCLEIIREALQSLGSDLSHVVRTRMYVTDITRWAEYGEAHHAAFKAHPPATSMVEVRALIHPDMLIEIEADAVLPD
jgi:enamine deaminase RidA (YjgF/YER057c/UK114 family)